MSILSPYLCIMCGVSQFMYLLCVGEFALLAQFPGVGQLVLSWFEMQGAT